MPMDFLDHYDQPPSDHHDDQPPPIVDDQTTTDFLDNCFGCAALPQPLATTQDWIMRGGGGDEKAFLKKTLKLQVDIFVETT